MFSAVKSFVAAKCSSGVGLEWRASSSAAVVYILFELYGDVDVFACPAFESATEGDLPLLWYIDCLVMDELDPEPSVVPAHDLSSSHF